MVESTGLENRRAARYRGFESLSLRHSERTMSAPMDSCRVEAPAKINLTLEILGKRPDGYHDIRSVVTPVALHDTVELRLAL